MDRQLINEKNISIRTRRSGVGYIIVRVLSNKKGGYKFQKCFNFTDENTKNKALQKAIAYRDASMSSARKFGYYILNPNQARPRMIVGKFPENIKIIIKKTKVVNFRVAIKKQQTASFALNKYGAGAIVLAWASLIKRKRIKDVKSAYLVIITAILGIGGSKTDFPKALIEGLSKTKEKIA